MTDMPQSGPRRHQHRRHRAPDHGAFPACRCSALCLLGDRRRRRADHHRRAQHRRPDLDRHRAARHRRVRPAFGLTAGLPRPGPGRPAARPLRRHRPPAPACAGSTRSPPASRVSTRIRNHQTEVTKVNDADGNPIEIAAVVVWRVDDTAQATFEVDDFREFVAIQAETAVRHIANSYPYDAHADGQMSLRDNADEITARLSDEIGARVAPAGVTVVESRLSHLAYAPEIAQAMLRRQQASAIVAARTRIVEGAVGMVELALNRLAEQQHRRPRRGAQGDDGQQPAGRALRRPRRAAGRQHRHASTSSGQHGGRTQEHPAAARPGRPRRARALGVGGAAQHERADRVPAAPGAPDAGRLPGDVGEMRRPGRPRRRHEGTHDRRRPTYEDTV